MKADGLSVSIIIPTYNRSDLLGRAIESVLAQTYKNFNIIVVDDGSTDNTPSVVEIFGTAVSYIRQQNQGPSAARNRGISEATGDLVAFLDSDDRWFPEKLEKQVALFMEDQHLGLVGSGYVRNGVGTEQLLLMTHDVRTLGRIEYDELMVHNMIATSTAVVRRECLSEQCHFETKLRFGEDWDLWMRIAAHWHVGYIKDPLVEVFFQSTGLTYRPDDEKFVDWEWAIRRNRSLARGWYTRNIAYRKAWSWFFMNKALAAHDANLPVKERKHLVQSILAWPRYRGVAYRYGRIIGYLSTFEAVRNVLSWIKHLRKIIVKNSSTKNWYRKE
jgi:glycosyltransferase involved in cell wall biosynthesis